MGFWSSWVHGLTSKTTPVDADELPLIDSAASNGGKKLTIANLKTFLGGLYAAVAHNHAATDITSSTLDGDRLPALSETKKGGVPATSTPSGKYLKDDGTWGTPPGTGVTDHGALTGLADDDHSQYHNDTRGDLRYAALTHASRHQHSGADEIATATAAANAIPKADGNGKLDTWVSDASDTVKGKVELATAAETTTGTDATRALTADGFAGSDFGTRIIMGRAVASGTALATGDGKDYLVIPAELNGFNLVRAEAMVDTVSSSGTPIVQVRNVTDSADMLSTRITIDASEFTSYSAATASVVDTSHDDVATGDRLAIDVDGAGTGTQGLVWILSFRLP